MKKTFDEALSKTISFDECKARFGGTTAAQVAAEMQGCQVKFLYGKNGKPFTTEAAINAAMGVDQAQNHTTEHRTQTIRVG